MIDTPLPKPSGPWRKPIPQSRDRLQSRTLVALTTLVLLGELAWRLRFMRHQHLLPAWWPWGLALSLTFALVVWRLRAATVAAAALGGLISLALIFGQGTTCRRLNAYPALLALFIATHLATRFGRRRKEAAGTAESRSGRRASQVAANLGIAALCATGNSAAWFAACLAALAEATADTVSSEVGQALAGPTFLITTATRVPPGTDGGISLIGTATGLLSALAILAVIAFTQPLTLSMVIVLFTAATAGLLFDSLLGATLERKGWLGNDLVNFSSTAFAAAVAYSLTSQ